MYGIEFIFLYRNDWVLEIDKIDLMEWKCFGIVISLVFIVFLVCWVLIEIKNVFVLDLMKCFLRIDCLDEEIVSVV